MKISRVSAAITVMAVLIGVLNVNGADPLPTNLPSGIVGWYAAGHGATNKASGAAADGDLVGTWGGNAALHAYQGLISEVILFNSVLSTADQATVNDYLTIKYAPPLGTIVIVY